MSVDQEEWAMRSGWVGLILAASLILTIIVMIWRRSNVGQISLIIPTYLVAAIIAFFPSIKSVEFGNLKAELQDRIDKATATLSQLRVIATYSVRQTLLSYAVPRMGYAGGRRTAFDMRDKAIKMLKDIEASREQLTEALSLFNPAVEQSIYVDVSNAIFRNLKRDPSKLSDYVNDFNRTFPENNINITSSNAWEAFARKYVAWNQELEDNFQDLAFFQSSKALRRPDIFYAGPYAVE